VVELRQQLAQHAGRVLVLEHADHAHPRAPLAHHVAERLGERLGTGRVVRAVVDHERPLAHLARRKLGEETTRYLRDALLSGASQHEQLVQGARMLSQEPLDAGGADEVDTDSE